MRIKEKRRQLIDCCGTGRRGYFFTFYFLQGTALVTWLITEEV
jgi:hypothetical protein